MPCNENTGNRLELSGLIACSIWPSRMAEMPAEEGSVDDKSSPYAASTAISRRSKLNASESTSMVRDKRDRSGNVMFSTLLWRQLRFVKNSTFSAADKKRNGD